MNEPRATITASKPPYRACFVQGDDLFLGQPDLGWVKLCYCGLSRNRLAGFRGMGEEVIVSAWVVRGVVGDMGISRQESSGQGERPQRARASAGPHRPERSPERKSVLRPIR
jgi:hypothetical protein